MHDFMLWEVGLNSVSPPGSAASFALAARSALVIGGGSGIGREIALGLAAAGAAVAVAGRRKDRLEEACQAIGSRGARARSFPADVTLPGAAATLAAAVESECGATDILVNAQGVMALKPAEDFDEADFDRIIDTNLKSVFLCCIAFGRRMLARGTGAIINIASVASRRGFAGNAVYCISKHGVVALTETLAAEWATRGVRVNAIAPGFFLTELNRDVMSEARKANAISRTPMRRFGEVEELVGAAVYLASPAAAYVTGATIPVDGGFLAAGM